MIKYYIPVKTEDKKVCLEGIDGGFINIDPLFKNVVARARKHNKAVRLPDNIKNIKLADIVELDIFYKSREDYLKNHNKEIDTNEFEKNIEKDLL